MDDGIAGIFFIIAVAALIGIAIVAGSTAVGVSLIFAFVFGGFAAANGGEAEGAIGTAMVTLVFIFLFFLFPVVF